MKPKNTIDISVFDNNKFSKYFIEKLLKNKPSPTDSQIRSAVGKFSGFVGIFLNIFLALCKFIVGTISNSVSITADALNNFSDAASSIVTLIGFRLAETPPDEDHPYGHARFEYLSGLAVSVMIILIGFELAKSSVDKILHPAAVEFSIITGVVLVMSILVKLWLSLFNGRLGNLINSTTLIATATDSRNDVLTTGAVLISSLIEFFTAFKIDGFVGLAVALFILYSGANLAKETISPLLGENANPEMKQDIYNYITAHPLVLGCHDLMVHDYGPGQCFASLHVEMDKDEDPLLCHDIIDNLERECFEEFGVHLVIHYDPIIVNDPEINRMREVVLSILKMRDERITIHDFRMVEGPTHTNLVFDAAIPSELVEKQNEIKAALDKALNEVSTKHYKTVILFDSIAFN